MRALGLLASLAFGWGVVLALGGLVLGQPTTATLGLALWALGGTGLLAVILTEDDDGLPPPTREDAEFWTLVAGERWEQEERP